MAFTMSIAARALLQLLLLAACVLQCAGAPAQACPPSLRQIGSTCAGAQYGVAYVQPVGVTLSFDADAACNAPDGPFCAQLELRASGTAAANASATSTLARYSKLPKDWTLPTGFAPGSIFELAGSAAQDGLSMALRLAALVNVGSARTPSSAPVLSPNSAAAAAAAAASLVHSYDPVHTTSPTSVPNPAPVFIPAAGFNPPAGSIPAAGFNPPAGSTPAAGFNPPAGSTPAAGFNPHPSTSPAAGFDPYASTNPAAGFNPTATAVNSPAGSIPAAALNPPVGSGSATGFNPPAAINPNYSFGPAYVPSIAAALNPAPSSNPATFNSNSSVAFGPVLGLNPAPGHDLNLNPTPASGFAPSATSDPSQASTSTTSPDIGTVPARNLNSSSDGASTQAVTNASDAGNSSSITSGKRTFIVNSVSSSDTKRPEVVADGVSQVGGIVDGGNGMNSNSTSANQRNAKTNMADVSQGRSAADGLSSTTDILAGAKNTNNGPSADTSGTKSGPSNIDAGAKAAANSGGAGISNRQSGCVLQSTAGNEWSVAEADANAALPAVAIGGTGHAGFNIRVVSVLLIQHEPVPFADKKQQFTVPGSNRSACVPPILLAADTTLLALFDFVTRATTISVAVASTPGRTTAAYARLSPAYHISASAANASAQIGFQRPDVTMGAIWMQLVDGAWRPLPSSVAPLDRVVIANVTITDAVLAVFVVCSGRGNVGSGTNECTCSGGWSGADCSVAALNVALVSANAAEYNFFDRSTCGSSCKSASCSYVCAKIATSASASVMLSNTDVPTLPYGFRSAGAPNAFLATLGRNLHSGVTPNLPPPSSPADGAGTQSSLSASSPANGASTRTFHPLLVGAPSYEPTSAVPDGPSYRMTPGPVDKSGGSVAQVGTGLAASTSVTALAPPAYTQQPAAGGAVQAAANSPADLANLPIPARASANDSLALKPEPRPLKNGVEFSNAPIPFLQPAPPSTAPSSAANAPPAGPATQLPAYGSTASIGSEPAASNATRVPAAGPTAATQLPAPIDAYVAVEFTGSRPPQTAATTVAGSAANVGSSTTTQPASVAPTYNPPFGSGPLPGGANSVYGSAPFASSATQAQLLPESFKNAPTLSSSPESRRLPTPGGSSYIPIPSIASGPLSQPTQADGSSPSPFAQAGMVSFPTTKNMASLFFPSGNMSVPDGQPATGAAASSKQLSGVLTFDKMADVVCVLNYHDHAFLAASPRVVLPASGTYVLVAQDVNGPQPILTEASPLSFNVLGATDPPPCRTKTITMAVPAGYKYSPFVLSLSNIATSAQATISVTSLGEAGGMSRSVPGGAAVLTVALSVDCGVIATVSLSLALKHPTKMAWFPYNRTDLTSGEPFASDVTFGCLSDTAYSLVITCSGNGQLVRWLCVCDPNWSGPLCDKPILGGIYPVNLLAGEALQFLFESGATSVVRVAASAAVTVTFDLDIVPANSTNQMKLTNLVPETSTAIRVLRNLGKGDTNPGLASMFVTSSMLPLSQSPTSCIVLCTINTYHCSVQSDWVVLTESSTVIGMHARVVQLGQLVSAVQIPALTLNLTDIQVSDCRNIYLATQSDGVADVLLSDLKGRSKSIKVSAASIAAEQLGVGMRLVGGAVKADQSNEISMKLVFRSKADSTMSWFKRVGNSWVGLPSSLDSTGALSAAVTSFRDTFAVLQACSGHGRIQANQTCACDADWTGRVCGLVAFDAPLVAQSGTTLFEIRRDASCTQFGDLLCDRMRVTVAALLANSSSSSSSNNNNNSSSTGSSTSFSIVMPDSGTRTLLSGMHTAATGIRVQSQNQPPVMRELRSALLPAAVNGSCVAFCNAAACSVARASDTMYDVTLDGIYVGLTSYEQPTLVVPTNTSLSLSLQFPMALADTNKCVVLRLRIGAVLSVVLSDFSVGVYGLTAVYVASPAHPGFVLVGAVSLASTNANANANANTSSFRMQFSVSKCEVYSVYSFVPGANSTFVFVSQACQPVFVASAGANIAYAVRRPVKARAKV